MYNNYYCTYGISVAMETPEAMPTELSANTAERERELGGGGAGEVVREGEGEEGREGEREGVAEEATNGRGSDDSGEVRGCHIQDTSLSGHRNISTSH